MNKSSKAIIVLILNIVFSLNAMSQAIEGGALSKLTPTKMPEAYKLPTGKITTSGAPVIKNTSGNYWLVYSDRDVNQTYKDQNLTVPFNKINFKEIFIVAAQNDKAVRLVTFDIANFAVDEDKGKVTFNANAQDAGWISKKNLLLWSVCLVDTVNNYARKAVAIKKLTNETGSITDMIRRGVLDFYDAPDKLHANDKDVKLFQYLFIFKEEAGMFLLGNINVVKANTITYDLYGWVSKSQVQEWTSAICLRVNFDEQAIDERDKNNIEPKFFRTEAQAIDYKEGRKADALVFNYSSPSDNRKDNPFLLGYPIISSSTKDPAVFRTGYVTNTVDKNGKNIFSALTGAELTGKFENIKNQKEKVNIVFVIDGAEKSFNKTLMSAIDANSSIGNTNVTNNKYQLGAVIYNDLSCGEEEAFPKIRFKTSKDNFLDNLKTLSDKKPACEISRIAGAPLNDALKMAADFFDNNMTTNIIIVIGNVTDNDATKKATALKSLINKNVKMVFYQTSNKNGKYYDDYTRNCQYFLEQISAAADADFKVAIEKKTRKKAELICEGEKCKLKNSSIFGEVYFKDEGRTFTPNEINQNLKNLFIRLEYDLNKTKAMFDENIVGTGKDKASSQEDESRMKEFQSWLIDAKISPETIQKLSTMDNYQLFIEGYTALKPKTAVNPIFERNLFVADKEFMKLFDMIEKVTDAFSGSDKRTAVVAACKEIIFTYKGPMDEKLKDKYSIDDIYNMITGLKGATVNKLFKKSLKDIQNDKLTPPAEIEKMYASFFRVFEGLRQLKRNELNRYEQDDQLFYWIPESKLSIDEQ